jgi:hypothetical protein
VTGTKPTDKVEVWFEGGGQRSDSFTYDAVSESGNRMLVVAAEDYKGASPAQPGVTAPKYLQAYLDARPTGVGADVYDVDARDRTAPDALGVLSHYKGVIWYTGDDIVTRKAGLGGGNADRLALDEILEMRAYMDEGGRVAYTGKRAGQQYSGAAVGTQLYDPKNEGPCNPPNATWDPRRCLWLRGSQFGGDSVNDILEYWFGGAIQVVDDGFDANRNPFGLLGVDSPFEGLSFALNGPESANNQDSHTSFVATSGLLDPTVYPQFNSWPSSRWDKPGGPFDPHTGNQHVYSQIADVSYKRLTREIAVPPAGGALTFWTSYDTEEHWDFLFVEARTAGGSDWTTLPDSSATPHTSQDTGESCKAENSGGWRTLHPFLDHYQTQAGATACTPTGTGGGVWNAASGNSQGWQQWRIDLNGYAGKTVEISIAYASDWATQNLGVFLDDFTWPGGSTSFEGTDTGGWQPAPAPAGSGSNVNNWKVAVAGDFPVGASISTSKSILMGYGFEGIAGADKRKEVMGRITSYLLR